MTGNQDNSGHATSAPETHVVGIALQAAEAGWNACRRQVYLLSEDYIDRTHPLMATDDTAGNFYRGQYDVAKSFAKAFNAFEARDCDYFKQIDFAALSTPQDREQGDNVSDFGRDVSDDEPHSQGLNDEQVEAVLHLVERRLCIIWAKVEAREDFANQLRVLEPAPEEESEKCEACGEAFEDGDPVYWMADDTGHIHADCCGPERESYLGEDGEPLKDGDPIPQPFAWRP